MTTPFPDDDQQRRGQPTPPPDDDTDKTRPLFGSPWANRPDLNAPGGPPPGGAGPPTGPPTPQPYGAPPPPGSRPEGSQPPPGPHDAPGGPYWQDPQDNPYAPTTNPYAPQGAPGGWQRQGPGGPPPPGGGYPPAPGGYGGPPRKGGKGVVIAIIVGVIAVVVLLAAVVWFIVDSREEATIDPSPSVDAVPTGPGTTGPGTTEPTPTSPGESPTDAYGLPPALAYEGDCLTDAEDVADVVTVACDDPDAAWEVVLRDDNPGEGTDTEVVRASCAGTGADDAIYALGDDAILRYVVCLLPVD